MFEKKKQKKNCFEDCCLPVVAIVEDFAMHDDQLKAKNDFLHFVKMVWPDFIDGYHHRIMAKKFEEIAQGKTKRLIVNMPPRHTKSEFASYLFPAWLMGNKPKNKNQMCLKR